MSDANPRPPAAVDPEDTERVAKLLGASRVEPLDPAAATAGEWTPEPWKVCEHFFHLIRKDDQELAMFKIGYPKQVESVREGMANAARTVACVNACKGIQDPERYVPELVAFVSQVRDELGKANETDCTLTISAVADRLRIRARKLLACHAPGREEVR